MGNSICYTTEQVEWMKCNVQNFEKVIPFLEAFNNSLYLNIVIKA